jgi:chromosome partitioning protein
MPLTITICNGKGGAGKTTLSVLLATAFMRTGHAVALLDRDPQATASRWLRETGDVPIVPADGSGDHRLLIIDTPPRLDSTLLHQALSQSHIAIIVTSPSPADLWSSQDTVAIVRQHLPDGCPARLLFNQVQARTVLARGVDDLAGRIGLPALRSRIGRRQTFQHAPLLGWSALDAVSREELLNAALEIAALAPPPSPAP